MEWHFTENRDVHALYLCWRAIEADRWDSLWFALNGMRPANWAFTQES